MNKQSSPFDPVFALQFMQDLTADEVNQVDSFDTKTELETLFYQLNQPIVNQRLMLTEHAFINRQLATVKADYSKLILQDDKQESLQKLNALALKPLTKKFQTEQNLSFCLQHVAAIELDQPCWLEQVFKISCSQSDVAMQNLQLYLQLIQKIKGKVDLNGLFQSLLLASGIEESAHHTVPSGDHDALLKFAVIQRALALFPRVFFAEILGFTLAYSQMAGLIECCFPEHDQMKTDYFSQRNQLLEQQSSLLLSSISSYLDCFPQQKTVLWQRIQTGFWLYQQQMQQCRDSLELMLGVPVSVEQAVIELFQKKALAAIGHHSKIMIQDKSLDSWFAGISQDPQAFLTVLKQSDYVDKQHPAQSRLLALFDFKGPMFGVMNETEISLIKDWLHSVVTDKEMMCPLRMQNADQINTGSYPIKNQSAVKKYQKLSHRALYYYLLNADLFPDVLPMAHAKVSKILKLCSLYSRIPFKRYSHEKFNCYIDTIYQQEMHAYQPLQGKPKTSKAAYIWGIKQIAPMILIDGCWLQNSLQLKKCYPEIADILFAIYCDEAGNGQLQQNHAYIFRQLMESLAIDMPSVHSREFVCQAGFINSSFDLPVFMLALSCFSVEFLPELLGLNMAIELSGLGKGYMSLVDEWRYWGIDPKIAEIHLSIDNSASGHTYLAKKAIAIYLDELMQRTADQTLVDQHWHRIYTGYASLRLVGSRFKWSLPIAYLLDKYN